jgi:glucan phosphoethanolaminetransferase (alkaline phosphatase superfamily)
MAGIVVNPFALLLIFLAILSLVFLYWTACWDSALPRKTKVIVAIALLFGIVSFFVYEAIA